LLERNVVAGSTPLSPESQRHHARSQRRLSGNIRKPFRENGVDVKRIGVCICVQARECRSGTLVANGCTVYDNNSVAECPTANTDLVYPSNRVGTFCVGHESMADRLLLTCSPGLLCLLARFHLDGAQCLLSHLPIAVRRPRKRPHLSAGVHRHRMDRQRGHQQSGDGYPARHYQLQPFQKQCLLELLSVWQLSIPKLRLVTARHFAALVSGQRLNGVELRGFSRRKIAKCDPCQKSTGEGDDDRYDSEDYAPTCDRGGC
jgi:hypothetical protein